VLVTIGKPMMSNEVVPEQNPTIDDFKRGRSEGDGGDRELLGSSD